MPAGLVGYKLSDGRYSCIDCDVYPEESKNIKANDTEASVASCCYCAQPLSEVIPLSTHTW
jgi:hypothetical protein